MKRAEAIEQLQNCIDLIKQDGKDYLDERDIPLLDMAIEALSKPNYESDNEVRLAVTNRKKEKVILWDAFGEVEYYPQGDMYCPNCGVRLVHEDEYLESTQTHGRLIDADALIDKLPIEYSGSPIHLLINDAPIVQADRPHGEWILECDSEGEGDNLYRCSECGCEYGCQEYDKPNFCPHCGVRMTKGGETE